MLPPNAEAGSDERFRVIDVVPFDEEDDSPLVGLLKVEAVEVSPNQRNR
jgi:hypothetical protein